MIQPGINYIPLTPLSFLERSSYVFPEKTAVIYNETRYTYRQFSQRVHRLAHALQKVGVTKGDRVAFLVPNIPPLLEAHYGVPLAGGILVAINIRLSPEEIAYIINHAEAKAFFVDSEFARFIQPFQEKMKRVTTWVNVVDENTGMTPSSPLLPGPDYETFLQEGKEESPGTWPEDENETITINYTSGTTGQPKGVMYTHRGAYLNALGDALELGLNSRSVYLWTLPMFHCNGWCFTWGVTATGGTHVCLRKVDPEQVFRLIEKEQVSHFCGAPVVLIGLAHHPMANQIRFSHPIKVATGGAPPSPTIIQKMEGMGIQVIHLYGLTETYGPNTVCEWQPHWDNLDQETRARLMARQGVSHITAEPFRVVDAHLNEVPADGKTMGEVVMRGNTVMKGYFKDPEATEAAFQGGWFHSGDLAVLHPDGYMELKDRKKDIIISGGENISTIEVENVLYKHPHVLEAAVIAIPDEKWGEVPKAFVTPKPGTHPTEQDLINFCREHLAHYKCPKVVEFCELPKTSTGKIQKYVLREKEWKGYEKRVH
jgi:fatty-acyl-CoA synthase